MLGFQSYFVDDETIMWTLRSKPDMIDRQELGYVSKETLIAAQTFPSDYDFMPDSYSNVGYILGMSVPPLMIKRLVTKLIEQGVYDYRLKEIKK